jgi:DNA-binding NtrC family response regulator
LTPDLQAKLLRVLEARRFTRVGGNELIGFRARVVAATHQDLEQRIREGKLRADLYYRLNVVTIDVPALAERREDISVLCNHFVSQFGRPLRFTKEALASLEQRPWPGNVRELRNAIERLALLCESDIVTETALHKVVPLRSAIPADSDEVERLARQFLARDMAGENKLDLMERTMVRIAMEVAGHNQSRAARILGLERKALERRFKRQIQDTSGEVRSSRSSMSAGDSDEHLT